MELMYDGTSQLAAGIRKDFPAAPWVAGYVNGRYAWDAAEWSYFPDAHHVLISVLSTANAGDVIDCEEGDATPAEAASWVKLRRAAGLYRPTVYCSKSLIPEVREATGSLVLGTDYDIWAADWTGTAHEVAGCAAVQYASAATYDVSAVYDTSWPHRSNTTPRNTGPYWPAGTLLEYGSTGDAVKALQSALNSTDHYGCRGLADDGIFGVMTRTAVRNYEAWQGITIDGEAGPEVREHLVSGGLLKN
jgi:hypothetical protein